MLGAGKWRGTPATVWRNVTPVFIYKALKKLPLTVENNGIASRDFIFVEDICRGLIACAEKGRGGEVYNIGSGIETTIHALGTMINKLTENNAGFEYLPKRQWDSSGKRFASTKKSMDELGNNAEVLLEEGLKRTIQWTRNNIDLIEATILKHKDKM